MIEVFTSDIALQSALAVFLALVIYLISLFLCRVQGMSKDEIVLVMKSMDKVDKNLSLFLSLSKKKSLERDKARKILLEIRILLKNSASVLQVYLYEKEDKPKIRSCITKLNALQNRCDNIALAYNNNKPEDLERTIEGIRADLKKVQTLLSICKKEQDEDRKKVI